MWRKKVIPVRSTRVPLLLVWFVLLNILDCVSFYHFAFGHCIICPSNYGFLLAPFLSPHFSHNNMLRQYLFNFLIIIFVKEHLWLRFKDLRTQSWLYVWKLMFGRGIFRVIAVGSAVACCC